MKRKFSILLVSTVLTGLVLSLAGTALTSEAAPESMQRKIVVFQTWFVNDVAQDELVAKAGGVKIKNLDLIEAVAVYLPDKAAERALEGKPEVLRIDDDVVVEALAKPAPTQPAETLPWGIDRIDADLAWGITTGDPIKVAIIDTGIDVKHPDLVGNL